MSWLSSEDLLKRILSLEFNRLIDYYKKAPKIDILPEKSKRERKARPERPVPSKDEKDRRHGEEGYERVYINVGKANGFFAPNLIKMINEVTHGQRINIGRIDLLNHYSLFDVAEGDAKRVIKSLTGGDFYGTRLYLEVAVEGKDYAAAGRSKKERARAEAQGPEHKKNRRERRAEKFGHATSSASSKNKDDKRGRRGAKRFEDVAATPSRAKRRSRREVDFDALGDYSKFVKKDKRKK